MSIVHATRIRASRHAFTLVELSIVLVILGLLIGGVLTGQSLIRAAELRSVSTQFQRYQAAVMTFRDKYFALPGDMTNATAYWGIAGGSTGNDSTCHDASSTTAATCNGNGDGQIYDYNGSDEFFRFWQHLANAGLIEGSYNGIKSASLVYSAAPSNAPVGRISGSQWHVHYMGAIASSTYYFDGDYGNSLQFGGYVSNYTPAGSVFKPEELYNLDVKMDDGKPATGKVVARTNTSAWSTQTCTDSTNSTTLSANYALNNPALGCAMIFKQPF